MKKAMVVTAWVLAVCVVWGAMVGCEKPAKVATVEPAAPAGWKVVYSADFKKVQKLPDCWLVVGGEASVTDGALVVKAAEGTDGQIVLKAPKCTGSVRLEVVACLMGAENRICDLSPFLNADESGFAAGYLLQFGAAENTENRIRRAGEVLDGTVKNKPLVQPGKKHVVVAENVAGKLRLTADGAEVLSYTDPEPLKGEGHGLVGFYTWGDTLKIEKITVWAKP